MAERLTMQEVIEHCDKTTRLMEKVFTCVHDGGEFGQIESKGYLEHKQTSEWLRELQKYKELEEQGRLIELPCAVGDTVYLFSHDIIHPFIINGFEINKYEVEFKASYCGEEKNLEHWAIRLPVSKICKTVFLTKEEAEEKLKELRGEQE